MFAEGIRIRSFHAGCAHEVKLPGGKTLLIDPFFRDSLSGGKTYSPETDIAKEAAGMEGHQECDTFGSMESVDYLLTTPSGFRLMTVSGRTVWDEPFEISREKCPDLLLRQAGVRRDGGSLFSGEQVTARELAELLVRYRAKIYMPFHMDVIYKRWGKEKTEEYFKEVGRFVELSAGSEFLFPEPWKWYRLGTAVEEEA